MQLGICFLMVCQAAISGPNAGLHQRHLVVGSPQPACCSDRQQSLQNGFHKSGLCESSACRMPRGFSYAFHLPDQRNSVVALPIGSGMSLRCRPQPCRRSGGQGQRLSGTAAPTLGGRPMPLNRSPLANCQPFFCEREGRPGVTLGRSFHAPAGPWWRRVSLWLSLSCFGPTFVMNIANSCIVVHNNVCNGVVLKMNNLFKINGLDQ